MMNTPNQTADIEGRIAAQFEETDSPEIASVYLFGSYADGRAHRESDVDIGVVMSREILPTRKERFEASLRLGTMLGEAFSVDRVDLVVLNDAPPLIGRRIVTDGRRIYCRRLRDRPRLRPRRPAPRGRPPAIHRPHAEN